MSQFQPAAFGRLCVETTTLTNKRSRPGPAAFGRLCVETQSEAVGGQTNYSQPPSGGCVLKLCIHHACEYLAQPAAFGRLCVETGKCFFNPFPAAQPPSGGCVLKHHKPNAARSPARPAAFGRLCVETARRLSWLPRRCASRLRAAVC